MKVLKDDIVHFFRKQGFVIVSTIDDRGIPHNSCKGIVKIEPSGRVYLLDLYKARTYRNLRLNPNVNLTAVDEHAFKGYCLKGKARIIHKPQIKPLHMKAWEDKLTSRIRERLLKNIRGEEGHRRHPESALPEPEYLIAVDINSIVDLRPGHIK